MGIFTVIVGDVHGGRRRHDEGHRRARRPSATPGDAARKIFQRIDKQIRYASSINRPGAGTTAGTYYVEYLVSAVDAGQKPLCTQWRYTASTRKLDVRTWRVDDAGRRPAWADHGDQRPQRPVACRRSCRSCSRPPTDRTTRQQLRVYLDIGLGPGRPQGRAPSRLGTSSLATPRRVAVERRHRLRRAERHPRLQHGWEAMMRDSTSTRSQRADARRTPPGARTTRASPCSP